MRPAPRSYARRHLDPGYQREASVCRPAIRNRAGAGLLPAEFPRSGIGPEPDYCRPNSRDQESGGSPIAAASAREGVRRAEEGGGAGERARGPGCAPRRLCGYGRGRGLETQRVRSRMGGCWIRTGTVWRRRMERELKGEKKGGREGRREGEDAAASSRSAHTGKKRKGKGLRCDAAAAIAREARLWPLGHIPLRRKCCRCGGRAGCGGGAS